MMFQSSSLQKKTNIFDLEQFIPNSWKCLFEQNVLLKGWIDAGERIL